MPVRRTGDEPDSTDHAVDSSHAAAKATMYLTLAADAERFGELLAAAHEATTGRVTSCALR